MLLLSSKFLFAQSNTVLDWVEPLSKAQEYLDNKKYALALDEFKKQAKLGNGLAQFNIALFYQFGWNRKPNPKEACIWFERAAKNGVPYAQIKYGDCLIKNINNNNHQKDAIIWYEKAAINGLFSGKCAIGEMYVLGEFVKQDIPKGLKMCINAANNGDIPSKAKLGKWYFNGQHVDQNYELAYQLLSESAEKQHAESAFYLAQYFDRGIGMEVDLIAALNWYETSASLGYQSSYLPTSAIYWQQFLDAQNQQKSALLAKSYLWSKTALINADNEKDMQIANALLAEIAKEMPKTWQADLDGKVENHQLKFH